MIKIEKLKDGAKVFIMRDGKRTQVLLNQLVSHAEFTTVEVEGGTLVYSVDETEVLELAGVEAKQINLNFDETIQDTVSTQENVSVDTPAEVPAAPAAPAIVRPAPRAKK